ncbi:Gfo/Idh/MocA family oxidoreductase [Leifsonia sp. ZF2019]|uniref:Gfo/Idh/MocA family protein n=1 Tax=Leifsonia sp. ZF2019 TaxID=2781978 RepID=UPI001CBB53F0|nr:Gfo/Idh/MocA family oxidoreductase [Leifsonia sp. ZF2019]UAJ79220.1 Gfo/Idh/MocA family oxidoreductase [Leifsonia sp. ZF2019]
MNHPTVAPIRTAIVGAGNIATLHHLPALRAHAAETELVAVVDVDLVRAEAFAREAGIPAAFSDLRAMLEGVNPDLVVVCTPPVAHREAVIAALDAGAWVWCEKPPALSLAEYDEMAAHEGAAGPYVSYVFQHRFGSAAQRLREHIASGELGEPLVGICHTLWFRDDAYYEVPWRGQWSTEGGGPTMGHGIHQMDLLLHVLGDWEEVRAMSGTLARDIETEDASFAAVRFASGAIVSVVNSILSPRETSYLRFDFRDATVEVEHLYGYSNSDWRWTPAPGVDPARARAWAPEKDLASSHTAQLAQLIAAYHDHRRPTASGEDGRRVLDLTAALYASAATGRAVHRGDITPESPFYATMSGDRSAIAGAEVIGA